MTFRSVCISFSRSSVWMGVFSRRASAHSVRAVCIQAFAGNTRQHCFSLSVLHSFYNSLSVSPLVTHLSSVFLLYAFLFFLYSSIPCLRRTFLAAGVKSFHSHDAITFPLFVKSPLPFTHPHNSTTARLVGCPDSFHRIVSFIFPPCSTQTPLSGADGLCIFVYTSDTEGRAGTYPLAL